MMICASLWNWNEFQEGIEISFGIPDLNKTRGILGTLGLIESDTNFCLFSGGDAVLRKRNIWIH